MATTLLIILFFAGLFRLTVLFAAPTLSTDQFRYTWEGRLLTQGISPYRYAPDDPQLAPYRSEIWPLVRQRETASPYPPLSQLIGAGEYLLFGDSLYGPKVTAIFFDLLNCAALLWLLRILGREYRWLIFYAWCPLPIIEFGQSGHNDAPMLFFLMLAVGLAVKQRPTLSAITLGLAALAKFTPLFGLPLFLVLWSGSPPDWSWQKWLFRPRWWLYPVLTLLVLVAGYIPLLILGGGALGSVLEYTGSWRDNDSLFFAFFADFSALSLAKFLSITVLLVIILLLSFQPRLALSLSLPRRLSLVLGVTLLVASTVHPWYVSWLLIFMPLVYGEGGFRLWDIGWLLFVALVQLPYLTYAGNIRLYDWIKHLEFWPLYLLIIWGGFGEFYKLKYKQPFLKGLIPGLKKESQVK